MAAAVASLLLILPLVALTQGAAVKDQIAAIGKKCVAETKLSPDRAGIAFNQEIPKTDSEKCFLECVYKGAGVVVDNKFSLAGSEKMVKATFAGTPQEAVAHKLVQTCDKLIAPKAGENCSLGRVVRECFVNNGKSVNFFPSAA
uniref:Odorant-binding protein 10 n=1 Tax=Yemma signatus TaxID=300820 RepID=A0A3G2GRS5_9HEMI|nr:odorant-binding protein 10 [Yemma signatus]